MLTATRTRSIDVRVDDLELVVVYEPGEADRTAGPPDSCSQGYPPEIMVEQCSIKIGEQWHAMPWALWEHMDRSFVDRLDLAIEQAERTGDCRVTA